MSLKDKIAPNKTFSQKTTSWPLLSCKIKKKNWQQIQSCEDLPFLGQNDQIATNKNQKG